MGPETLGKVLPFVLAGAATLGAAVGGAVGGGRSLEHRLEQVEQSQARTERAVLVLVCRVAPEQCKVEVDGGR